MKSEKIQQEHEILREYQISHADFFKFFPIEGDFRAITIETGSVKREKGLTSVSMNGKPWIRLTTIERSSELFKEEIGAKDKGDIYLS